MQAALLVLAEGAGEPLRASAVSQPAPAAWSRELCCPRGRG